MSKWTSPWNWLCFLTNFIGAFWLILFVLFTTTICAYCVCSLFVDGHRLILGLLQLHPHPLRLLTMISPHTTHRRPIYRTYVPIIIHTLYKLEMQNSYRKYTHIVYIAHTRTYCTEVLITEVGYTGNGHLPPPGHMPPGHLPPSCIISVL